MFVKPLQVLWSSVCCHCTKHGLNSLAPSFQFRCARILSVIKHGGTNTYPRHSQTLRMIVKLINYHPAVTVSPFHQKTHTHTLYYFNNKAVSLNLSQSFFLSLIIIVVVLYCNVCAETIYYHRIISQSLFTYQKGGSSKYGQCRQAHTSRNTLQNH